ncbi:GyrI-like domain-containing protein [Ferruginibacter paludis]|uniref:GyrI-like domain-containing protein n=1 Tax=Ferruginibacter paludis TaxID=1310417 RepID=UPI0025B2D0F7|nr:GyrI-like domain-containing protein [Ferruginibacter paludis]MDN3658682.1 GyrI-like domain-containing protein [Ferruginibacter paludis]
MKKIFVTVLGIITLAIVAEYFLIPNIVMIKASAFVSTPAPAIHRMLLNKTSLAKWWPGKTTGDSLFYNNLLYKIKDGNITVIPVSVANDKLKLNSSLYLVSLSTDSTRLEWVGSAANSNNPVKRLQNYLQAKQVNRDFSVILQKMTTFYSDPVNIYGSAVKKALISDSLLLATAASFRHYPTTKDVYDLIDKLGAYIAFNKGRRTGFPMLNISTNDSIQYDVKVALPTDKPIKSSENFEQKRMPGKSVILFSEVKGGTYTCANALDQLQQYADDRQLRSPAIPFYSLVTDRRKETDSSTWITRVYFPVMLYQ